MKARCSEKPDLVIRNVQVFNTAFRGFYPADVYLLNGRFYYVDIKKEHLIEASETVEGHDRYMIPGLIDIHMHIESSMMTPAVMARRLAECGVTTIVAEPHEMANVNGIRGIQDTIGNGKEAPIDIFYGIPSCVPATRPDLETTGGIIDAASMTELIKDPAVVCVGEVMNYREIIKDNDLEISRLLNELSEKDPRYTVEGHCPALKDEELAKFIYLGIDSDHTEHDIEELKQRFFQGMYVELQEKMLKREVIDFIDKHSLYDHFGFVTDDVMADTLMEKGHLDHVIRLAIGLGMSPEQAIYHATCTNARRMKLTDRGQISPGKLADFSLLTDLRGVVIDATYKNGRCIYRRDEKTASIQGSQLSEKCDTFSKDYFYSVKVPPVKPDRFVLKTDHSDTSQVLAEVMEVSDGSTKTTRSLVWLPVEEGIVRWQHSGCLLTAVFERYGKSGRVGYGLVSGDFMKEGAVATTYAHDHHNLVVVGSNEEDMALAANSVISAQGGICVTKDGVIKAFLPLPIGGILSDLDADEVGKKLKEVRDALIAQGYRHYNPIMSLCTLSLLASPAIKISDFGLIDVTAGEPVPLIREELRL